MGNKYGNIPTEIDNIVFASKKEALRYSELKLLQGAGVVSDLQWQLPFSLDVNGVHICDYIADYVYVENGQRVVEDVKGVKRGSAYTIFKMKKRLMKALNDIDVLET